MPTDYFFFFGSDEIDIPPVVIASSNVRPETTSVMRAPEPPAVTPTPPGLTAVYAEAAFTSQLKGRLSPAPSPVTVAVPLKVALVLSTAWTAVTVPVTYVMLSVKSPLPAPVAAWVRGRDNRSCPSLGRRPSR